MQINFHEEATSKVKRVTRSGGGRVELQPGEPQQRIHRWRRSRSHRHLRHYSATSRWRVAAGAVVLLYLQGGTAALIATSKLVETEIKATPDFFARAGRRPRDLGGVPGRDATAIDELKSGAGRSLENFLSQRFQ
jgi:hypothetical protein